MEKSYMVRMSTSRDDTTRKFNLVQAKMHTICIECRRALTFLRQCLPISHNLWETSIKFITVIFFMAVFLFPYMMAYNMLKVYALVY